MKKLLIFFILAIAPLMQCKDSQSDDIAGIYETKAYAKGSGRAYSCDELLRWPKSQKRDGSYFEPEDLMRYYMECANRYPRSAQVALLDRFETCLNDNEVYEKVTHLLNNGFKFSPAFKAIITEQLTAAIGRIIQPIVFKNEHTNGTVYHVIDAFSHRQTRPNCTEIEQFVKEHGLDKSAAKVMPLCELKNRLAPPLMPR